MKIKVVHGECGREVMVQQLLDSQGHCPWDGKAFSKDYTAVLAESLESAEWAGGSLENALEKIVGMDPDFVIDRDSVLGTLEAQIARLRARKRGARA